MYKEDTCSLLIRYSRTGNLYQLQKLREIEFDVNYVCGADDASALFLAASNGHYAVCDWLIRKGAQVNVLRTKCGSSPLHVAANNGHYDCCYLLIVNGCEVNTQTTCNFDTALHLAAYRGHREICRLLLEKEANPAMLNSQRRTPADEAKIRQHYEIYALITSQSRQKCRVTNSGLTINRSQDYPLKETFQRCVTPQFRSSDQESGRTESFEVIHSTSVAEQSFKEGSDKKSRRTLEDISSTSCNCRKETSAKTAKMCGEDVRFHLDLQDTAVDTSIGQLDGMNCDVKKTVYKTDDVIKHPPVRRDSSIECLPSRASFPNLSVMTPLCKCSCENNHRLREAENEALVRKLQNRVAMLERYAEQLEMSLTVEKDKVEKLTKEQNSTITNFRRYDSIIRQINELDHYVTTHK